MCSCHNFQNLPPQCRLIPDPNNSCCKTYVCDVQVTTTQASIAQGGVPTPVAGVGESSFDIFNTDYNDIIVFIRLLLVSAGVTHNYAAMRSDLCAAIMYMHLINVCADYCVYNGRYYRQGEEWYDGCSLKCRCEDARHHYHQCTTR